MRYPREQKAESRRKILNAAARLFRESGYNGVGVDAIMGQVGLTAGGFYSHFASKEALFAEAMETAPTGGETLRTTKGYATAATDPLAALIKGYLSRAHRDAVGEGCPLPAITTDVARKSGETRESYDRKFLRYVNQVEALLPEGSAPARELALAVVAQCVGGLMLARAVKDQKLSDQILKSCRDATRKMCAK